MASELVKRVTCDVCGAEGATEYGPVRAMGGPRDVDLCPAHLEPLQTLETFLAAYSRAPGRAPSLPGSRPPRSETATGSPRMPEEYRTCPACRYVCPTRGALSVHARGHHGQTLSELERAKGVTYTCPRGDFTGTYSALAQHVGRASHGPLK